MNELAAQLFEHGPLYDRRFEILRQLNDVKLRSGDILYRASDAKGPLGLPFTKLVSRFTNSPFSHAAIVLVQNGQYNVLEVNDQGTLKYRMLDWLDTCYQESLAIYRLKDLTHKSELKLKTEIVKFLEKDPDYDLNFSDPDKFYCTESIIEIYKNALSIQLIEGQTIWQTVNVFQYVLLLIGSYVSSFFGASLPFGQKMYFPGNEKQGMISSPYTYKIFEITRNQEWKVEK